MRTLFLILVLVDLAIVARYTVLVPARELAPPLPEGVARLQRVEEVDAEALMAALPPAPVSEPSGAPAVDEGPGPAEPADSASQDPQGQDPEPAVVAAAPPVCRSVGPFTDVGEAARVAEVLGRAGYAPVQRVAEGQVWLGHWVYLAPFPSIQEAEEVAAALERNLVEDYYVVREGDRARAISLGVYSNREGAESRLAEMREKGFPAEITDRYRAAAVYWLDFAEDPARPVDLSALQAAAPGRIIRMERGACELP